MHLAMIQCDTIGMWLGANCCIHTHSHLEMCVCCSAEKEKAAKKTSQQTNDETTTLTSMWLRVVLLDRHNIWDVHGCRSHTFRLFYCIYYILHTKIIDRTLPSRGIFCHCKHQMQTKTKTSESNACKVCEGIEKDERIGVRFALIMIKIKSSKAVNIMSLSTINKACN